MSSSGTGGPSAATTTTSSTALGRNLVTTTTLPAGNNHPLAVSPPPIPPSRPTAISTASSLNNANNNNNKSDTPTTPPIQRTLSAGSPSSPLDEMADIFLSIPSYRSETLGLQPLLRPTMLPREEGIARLRILVERRAWGDVLKISTGMLNSTNTQYGDVYASLIMLPLNAPQVDISSISMEIRLQTVEIMTLQCHAWLKLRRYADLSAEVERWNFVPHNDAAAQAPDWLPWGLRILAGQTQQFSENSDRANDILFAIRGCIPDNEAVWLTTIDNVLANMFLRQSQWRLALGSLDRVLERIPSATQQYVKQNYPNTTNGNEMEEIFAVAFRCEILSRQGRIFLQIGALPEVASIFAEATHLWGTIESRIPVELRDHSLLKVLPIQVRLNEGLLEFAESRYDTALTSFSEARDLVLRFGLPTQSYDAEEWMGPTVAGNETLSVVYTECINNMALSALYMCRMEEAIDLLEDSIRDDPGAFLTERAAFNLCTLYELGGDSAMSAQRKRVLQIITKRFFLHDIGPENFRLS